MAASTQARMWQSIRASHHFHFQRNFPAESHESALSRYLNASGALRSFDGSRYFLVQR